MTQLSNATALILAGGLGTRLRSVVPDRPKVMAEVSGRPFVEYLLDQLVLEGIQCAVFCTGHMADQIENRFGARYRNLALQYSREPHPLGTAGALRRALPVVESELVLVLNGDSFCDARLDAFAAWHDSRKSRATILLSKVDDTERYGSVEVDGEGRVLRFSEKHQSQGPGSVNAGIYLLDREMIKLIPPDINVSIERDVFPGWIDRGLHGFLSEGNLWDIGVPDAYARANTESFGGVARANLHQLTKVH